jgi:hypothetical protein
MKSATIIFFLNMASTAHAQTSPYKAQFRHLMGEPNEIVSALVNYPWKDNPQVSVPELSNTPHGSSIRIVSVERPVSNYSRWSHWDSSDRTTWIDILDFPSRDAAIDLLGSAAQFHSGYRGENQLLLFTNLCDAEKDGVGAALLGHS